VELLKDSERRTTSVQWPAEVDAHLDLLRRVAAEQGVQISRAQLLAALVADATLDGRRLAAVAVKYLRRLAGDLERSTEAIKELPSVRQPGRRRRTQR
jgi:DNA-binding response OmpR family regulator